MKILEIKYIPFFAVAALGLAMTACSDKDDPDPNPNPGTDGKQVVITADVYTKANVTLELKDGNDMTVFSKSNGSVQAADYQAPTKATLSGNTWNANPGIGLKEGKTVFLYAVAPHSASNVDPQKVPVDTKAQNDVLYSGEFRAASVQTNTVKFQMKHALAMMSFNIAYQGGNATPALTSVSVSGENVPTTGELNVETGKITPKGYAQVSVDVNKKISNTGWSDNLPGQWVIPFDNSKQGAQLTATIDGTTYVVPVPAVNVRPGYQYIFHLVLTPNGLVFDASATEEISLRVSSDEMKPMQGYGSLKFGFSGSDFIHPMLEGNEVFGNVASGSTRATYVVGGKTTIPGTGTRQVVVESWNSHGFGLVSLEGIESIDISAY